MPVPTDITAGTLTITNGSTAVTGVGTSWLASDLRQGDIILWIEGGDGFQTPILADVPASNTALTLVEPWEGPTLTSVRYRIRYQWDSSRVSAQSRQLIEMLDNGNVLALSGLTGPGVPVFDGPHSMTIRPEADFVNGVAYDVQVDTLTDRDAYDGQAEGFAVLVSDVGDGRSAIYSKASNTSGDWTAPAYVTGATGGTPDIAAGTTTTLPPGDPADVTIDPDGSGGYLINFDIPAGEGFYNAGAYDIGIAYDQSDVVRHNGSSFIALQAVPAGESPSSASPPVDTAYWQVLAAKGSDGAGTGDVVGPSGAVADRIAVYDGTTGKLIKDGGVTIAEIAASGDFVTYVDTLTGLADLAGTKVAAYLTLPGREGTFTWNASNLSARVTLDPDRGVYVPPTSDTTGASGAWVRVLEGELWLNWFGFGGATTALNNTLIFNRVIILAQTPRMVIRIPPGQFDISVIGGGGAQNNGIKLVSDTHIKGSGPRKSVLNLIGASPKANVDGLSGGSGIGRNYTPGAANVGVTNVLLEEFAVTMNHPGNSVDPTTHLQVAIDFRNISRSTIRRCFLGNYSPINGTKGFTSDYLVQGFAIALGGASGGAIDYTGQELNIIEECTIVGARHGISMEFVGPYSGAAYQTTIRRNDIQMCQRLIVQYGTGGGGSIISGNTLQNLVKPNGDATSTIGIWMRGHGNIIDEAYGEYGTDGNIILYLEPTSARNWIRYSGTVSVAGGLVVGLQDQGTNNVIEYFANTAGSGAWESFGAPRRRVNQVDSAIT